MSIFFKLGIFCFIKICKNKKVIYQLQFSKNKIMFNVFVLSMCNLFLYLVYKKNHPFFTCLHFQKLGHSKFSLLGWSDGGNSAAIMAAKYPKLIRKLVVWGSNSFVTQEELKSYQSKHFFITGILKGGSLSFYKLIFFCSFIVSIIFFYFLKRF